MIAPEGANYTLSQPLAWRCTSVGTADSRSGETETVSLFLESLEPDTEYTLTTTLGDLTFQTLPCAGLCDITSFGADPAADDNAAAIQLAIDSTPEGGTLFVPPGRFVTRPVFLRSNMTLYLPEGAQLAAPGDREGWPILPAQDETGRNISTWEGLPEASFAAVITAVNCDNLTITGRGVVDGGGDRGDWWQWPKETRDGARRPRTLFLAHSRNVILSGVTVCNSPSWTVHPFFCNQLTAAALFIQNPPDSPNTDGLNPESCCDITLTAIAFSVGDDCIAVKAGKRGPGQSDHLAPTRRLSVTHCQMARGHGAVVLGSEMSGEITDVEIAHCEFDGTDRGLRIKTRRGRGGRVSSVVMSDIVMTGVGTPLAVNAFYFCDADGHDHWVQNRAPAVVDETTPVVKDITVKRVRAEGVMLAAAAILGLPEAHVTGVTIDDFQVSYNPDAKAEVPLMADNVKPTRHAGLIAEFAQVTGEVTLIPGMQELAKC